MAVTVLVLIDPLLVWSVSFWLSVSATAGLVWITPALARVVPGPRLVAVPMSVTTGAQLGVLPIATLVFGLPSSISLVTNLVAVPVGGAVMLVGLPLALGAGALPLPLAGMAMWPAHLGVRWVAGVARVGDNLAPSGRLDVVAWVLVGAAATAAVVRRRRGR
jgi:competence protein ComEC